MKKSSTRLWISILASALFIVLTLYKVDFQKTGEALETANYIYLPLGVMLSLLTNIIRSYRWKYVLNPIQKISILSVFSVVSIGYMANNILPARLGEFVRAYIIGKKEGISKSTTLATIVVERIFDGLTLLFFLTLISLFFPLPLWIKRVGFAATVFFLSLSVFLLILMFKKTIGIRLVERGVSLFSSYIAQRASRLMDSFLSGLVIINHKKDILMAFLFSVIAWLAEATTYYVIGLSFGIDLPLYVPVLTVVIVNLGIMIPSAPGYVGTFEFFCISVLAIFSVEKSIALSFAIVLHAVLFIPITIVGMIYFWKENLSFAEIDTVKLSH
ncbi:MAG: hypothetical protein C4291_00705 [Candidatus Dadabacteria bacterium]